MRVVIYANLSLPFSPRTLQTRALGGSESALYYLTREMARLGMDITILNHCGAAAGACDGVRYVDLDRQGRWRDVLSPAPDVLVVFRQTTDLFKTLPGRLRILWAHDHIGAFPERTGAGGPLTALGWRLIHEPFAARVDVVAAVSRWLARSFHDHWGLPWERLFVTRNGIDLTAYETLPPSRHQARLVYT
ncbi:MAG: glycosyltransferase, partial [Armatimonadetes bacterium]|nr:glycosyltransferase [Armatimonadota bacterium]